MAIYGLITFVLLVINLDKRKKEHLLLLAILASGTANEVISLIFELNDLPIRLNTTLYVIVYIFLWLALFFHVSTQHRIASVAAVLFGSFTIYNFVMLDGINRFNYYTFVVGALLYVILFIYHSAIELRKENLNYFMSNRYLLLASPVLFFITFSFLFGFRGAALSDISIFKSFTLFDFISYFANIAYYTLINLYIYYEKKSRNVE